MSSGGFVGSAIIMIYFEGDGGGMVVGWEEDRWVKRRKKKWKWGCYKDWREKLKVLVGQFKLVLIV